MKKRNLPYLFALILVMLTVSAAASVVRNTSKPEAAMYIGGLVYASEQVIESTFGATITCRGVNVTLNKGAIQVRMELENRDIYVSGKKARLTVVTRKIGDTVYLSPRYVAEWIGGKTWVDWKQDILHIETAAAGNYSTPLYTYTEPSPSKKAPSKAEASTKPASQKFTFITPTEGFKPIKGSCFSDPWLGTNTRGRCLCGIQKRHTAVDADLGCAKKPVRASCDGVIKYAGSFGKGWGNCVIYEYTDPKRGICTALCGHITIASGITPGKNVSQGETIGWIDPNVSPPHLHFGCRHLRFELSISIRGALPICDNKKCGLVFPTGFFNPLEYWPDLFPGGKLR